MRENIFLIITALLVFGGIGAFLLSIAVMAFTFLEGWPRVALLGVVAYCIGGILYMNWESFRGQR